MTSMKRIVLTFGLISGAIASLLMLLQIPLIDRVGFERMEVVGYTAIIASMLLVFFGIRAYREHAGGVVTFGRAFTVGILITLVSCACYVATWQVVYFNFAPDFMDRYSAYAIERVRASGASQSEIDATARRMRDFKELYDKPLVNAAFTFMEPFPIGLLVTLVSAAVLRRSG